MMENTCNWNLLRKQSKNKFSGLVSQFYLHFFEVAQIWIRFHINTCLRTVNKIDMLNIKFYIPAIHTSIRNIYKCRYINYQGIHIIRSVQHYSPYTYTHRYTFAHHSKCINLLSHRKLFNIRRNSICTALSRSNYQCTLEINVATRTYICKSVRCVFQPPLSNRYSDNNINWNSKCIAETLLSPLEFIAIVVR